MVDSKKKEVLDQILGHIRSVTRGVFVLVIGVVVLVHYIIHPWSLDFKDETQIAELPKYEVPAPEFENGIHLRTGFKEGENLDIVIANCTSCHSAKMVTQNKATRDGWKSMILWMQETQNLWDLGENEPLILDYLAKYYAPEKAGRRQPLANIDWYELED